MIAGEGTRVTVPKGRERPPWAKRTGPNCRGRVDPGPHHYLAVVTISGATVEGIVDTGACRTMMDLDTAKALGLPTEERDPKKQEAPFGRFHGPDGVPRPYEGRIGGGVYLRFSDKVALRIPEVKLIRSGGPLFLIGTDILGPRKEGWTFLNVGYDPKDMVGTLTFGKNKGSVREVVELAQAPGA